MTVTAEFIPADQEVRERVVREVAQNFCLEAGAGTGKTTVLVDRIVQVLRTGHATIDEIAVITFTEKAAAELAARVRLELEDAIATAGEGPERDNLQQAMLGLHRARIETIHAFAANLLRERPVEAKLDPNFDVLDSLAADIAFMGAYEKWLDELLGDEGAGDEELRRILNRGFDLKQIEDCARSLHEQRDMLPLEPYETVTPDVAGHVRTVEQVASELTAIRGRCIDLSDRGTKHIDSVVAFAAELAAAEGNEDRLEYLILQRSPRPNKNVGTQKNYDGPGDAKRLKELIGEFRASTDEVKAQLQQQAMAQFMPRAERFVRAYERERRMEGRAEFNDLLLWARDLVRDNEEVRRYFQGRFKSVLVDEFQDTDPVQAELVAWIASEVGSKAEHPQEWTDLPLRPGALFVVGDPKQSIYRFRRADMTVYGGVKEGLLGEGVCKLQQNFRSNDGVIGWVNTVFDVVLVENPGVQPANIPLVHDPRLERTGVHASVIVAHGDEAVGRQGELRTQEAEKLAALIKRAVGEERWQVRDRRTKELRDASWGDVAVIVPYRTEIELYERAFESAGLPYRHEGNRAFFQRQEVRDLADCLYAIDDPTDRLNLVAALRSAAFACSDQDVLLFNAAGGRLDYRTPGDVEGHQQVVGALRTLHELHRARRQMSLPELVHELLQRTNLIDSVLTDRVGGVQAAGNLLKVVDQARAFAGVDGGGLRSFARWLATSSDPEQEEAEASVIEETDDVVRLLTIHAAKGLEFPIVALANSNARHANNERSFADRGSGRLQVRATYGWKTPGFDDAWGDELAHGLAERARMLYVAATRARDHLIVPLIARENGKGAAGLMEMLEPHLPEWEDERAGTDVDGCYVYDRALLERAVAEPKAEVEVGADEVAQALASRGAWVAERDGVVKTADEELAWVTASGQEKWEGRPAADDELRVSREEAAAIGTALHRVMEVVDLASGENLDAIATAMCVECGVPDAVEEVVEMARNCLDSEVVKRAVAAGPSNYWREVPFTAPRDLGGFDVGRMDLVFREADASVVVDFKTDQLPDDIETWLETYRPQGGAYSLGLTETGSRVGDIVFVLARSGHCASAGGQQP